jgi:hypothetical protein
MAWGGLWGMIGVDKIGEIRRAYFERHRSIKEIVRTLSVFSLVDRSYSSGRSAFGRGDHLNRCGR